jgi:ribokinase
MGSSFLQSFGGKGANQAVQCARLGVSTQMIGMLGNDNYGNQYMTQLIKQGVSVHSIGTTSEASSGIASIWVDSKGNNSIVIVSGANSQLSTEHVEQYANDMLKAKIVIFQNEIPSEVTRHALQLCRNDLRTPKPCTIFNPAPSGEHCKDLIQHCDIVCLNEIELNMISSMPVDSLDEIIEASQTLLQQHASQCHAVVATVGSRGAVLVKRSSSAVSNVEVSIYPAEQVKAVDTVGAGDSFIGRSQRRRTCAACC